MNGKIFDVNQTNFQREVIDRSFSEPVLVDFWAPWCGPCRMLGPILERVASESGSGFVLAKLNSDQNPGLSSQYDVRGIPAVKAFVNGRVVDEFVGAQPEPMVRQFTQRVKVNFRPTGNGQSDESAAQTADPQTRLSEARQYLIQGNGCKAQSLLVDFPSGSNKSEADQLHFLAQFMCTSGRELGGSAEVQNFYHQAASALQRREASAALYSLLVVTNQESQSRREIPKSLMLAIFTLLGNDHTLTKQYRPLVA